MNPLLTRLQPYPFERLRELTRGIAPNPAFGPISLGIGEPRHATPALVTAALAADASGLAHYPTTIGAPPLREAIVVALREAWGWGSPSAARSLPPTAAGSGPRTAKAAAPCQRPMPPAAIPSSSTRKKEGAGLSTRPFEGSQTDRN